MFGQWNEWKWLQVIERTKQCIERYARFAPKALMGADSSVLQDRPHVVRILLQLAAQRLNKFDPTKDPSVKMAEDLYLCAKFTPDDLLRLITSLGGFEPIQLNRKETEEDLFRKNQYMSCTGWIEGPTVWLACCFCAIYWSSS